MAIRWLKKGISAALAGGLFLSLAATARAVPCTSTLNGGTYTDILVPTGAVCTLEGVTVTGNVVVQRGASLFFGTSSAGTTSVTGNVIAVDAGCIELPVPTATASVVAIGGNVVAIGTQPEPGAKCAPEVCPTKVAGNVAILASANESFQWDFCANITPSSTVGGNLVFAFNPSDVSGFIETNTIQGNLLFDYNQGVGIIYENTVGGNLECSGNNTMAPLSGSGNTVGGAKLGQCSTF